MAEMEEEPGKQHKWLQKLVGEWTYEGEAMMTPEGPPEKFTGTETVRAIGGLWTMGEGTGTMPDGTPATTIITLGYDPKRERFVGTFIASMMTYMWVYEGRLDDSGRKLALDTEGPDMAVEGKTTKYRETIEFISDDHRTFSSSVLAEGGKWRQIMTMHYRRK